MRLSSCQVTECFPWSNRQGGKKRKKNLSMMVSKPTAQKCKWTLSSVCSKVALQQWKNLIHIKCSQQYQRRVEFSQSKSQRTGKKVLQTANWGRLQRQANAQMCSRNIFLQPANRFRTDNYFLRNGKKLFFLTIPFVTGPKGHPWWMSHPALSSTVTWVPSVAQLNLAATSLQCRAG